MSDFFDLLKSQHLFFESGQTKSYDFRLSALTDLENALIHREHLILAALKKDLNKAPFESYATELIWSMPLRFLDLVLVNSFHNLSPDATQKNPFNPLTPHSQKSSPQRMAL